jgi:hypothetical protein
MVYGLAPYQVDCRLASSRRRPSFLCPIPEGETSSAGTPGGVYSQPGNDTLLAGHGAKRARSQPDAACVGRFFSDCDYIGSAVVDDSEAVIWPPDPIRFSIAKFGGSAWSMFQRIAQSMDC